PRSGWRADGRPDDLPAFGLRLGQLLSRYVGRIHIQMAGLFQTHLGLLLLNQTQASRVASGGRLSRDRGEKVVGRLVFGLLGLRHRLSHLHLVADMLLAVFALSFGAPLSFRVMRVVN